MLQAGHPLAALVAAALLLVNARLPARCRQDLCLEVAAAVEEPGTATAATVAVLAPTKEPAVAAAAGAKAKITAAAQGAAAAVVSAAPIEVLAAPAAVLAAPA